MKRILIAIFILLVLSSTVGGTLYEWIGGGPVQTDDTNFEWSGGSPSVIWEYTTSASTNAQIIIISGM